MVYNSCMSNNKECPFCNPTQRVLKENKLAYVILSDPRKVPGHFLVNPKRHIEEPWELTKDELADIFELIFFVQKKILGKLGDGTQVRQNYLPFIEQGRTKIDHVHFHVIPRSLNDYLYTKAEQFEADLFTDLDEVEAAEVAKLLND
jgi:diadenosine tetraphosphate (Ap4A) HIT family hydrolase